jgi:ABC-type lipoprotein export system ATPase subunit
MLETNNISYQYPEGESLVFNDLKCSPGDKLLILGESGSGKTTLLHLIAGILRPATGTISIDGIRINMLPGNKADAFRGSHIGMVFQQHFFLQGLSVFENLAAARRFAGLKTDRVYLERLVEAFGIGDLSQKKPEALSQGEQQRFSIARALSNNPKLLLADEPTSSLDDKNCEKFIELINSPFAGRHACWIIATHDLRLKQYFKHIYELN